MEKKIVSTRDIIEVGVFMLICFFTLDPIGKILIALQKKIYGGSGTIFFSEGLFSGNISSVMTLILLAVIYVSIFRKDLIQPVRIKIGLITGSILLILFLILSFLSSTAFYDNKIVDYNLSHLAGRTYSYSDVTKVTMGKTTGSDSKTDIYYGFSMKDGSTLNIRALPDEAGDINKVEEKIAANVPHYINKTDYDFMIKNKVALPEGFESNFKIK